MTTKHNLEQIAYNELLQEGLSTLSNNLGKLKNQVTTKEIVDDWLVEQIEIKLEQIKQADIVLQNIVHDLI